MSRSKVRKDPLSISGLPNTPGVYALYGGSEVSAYVAYVGIAGAGHRDEINFAPA